MIASERDARRAFYEVVNRLVGKRCRVPANGNEPERHITVVAILNTRYGLMAHADDDTKWAVGNCIPID